MLKGYLLQGFQNAMILFCLLDPALGFELDSLWLSKIIYKYLCGHVIVPLLIVSTLPLPIEDLEKSSI